MNHETDSTAESKAEASFQHTVNKRLIGLTYWKPVMRVRFKPKCHNCGAPADFIRSTHPLAQAYPALASDERHGQSVGDVCIVCGTRFPAPLPEIEVPAEIIGFSPAAIFARACLNIGRWLMLLRKGLLR